MKKMIIVLFFLKMSIIPGFAQLDAITNGINQLNPNRFEIIDVKKKPGFAGLQLNRNGKLRSSGSLQF